MARNAHATRATFLASVLLNACFALFGVGVGAQEVIFLAIRGDGTASLILDRPSRTAYIHDGGRAGIRGMARATVSGEPLLGYLHTKGITTVVFSCSHPHADHMGALKATVMGNEVLKFPRIAFVDAILPGTLEASGKSIERLQQAFINAHGEELAKQKLLMPLEPAIDSNRFAELKLGSNAVVVKNFQYDPKLIGMDIHDQSLIVETRVQAGSAGKTIVDFDDASGKLIAHWASKSPPPDVVVMAHHGSRNNNMEPVLRTLRKGTSYVIFTANIPNQFFHPSPQALRAAIDAVGIDRVYVTGSQLGNNIVITPDGVSRSERMTRPDVATLIRQRVARASAVIDSPKAAERTKTQAKADMRDLLSLAEKHHIQVDRQPGPKQGAGLFSATHQTATQLGGSTPGTAVKSPRPDPRPDPTKDENTGLGTCICVTTRNGVVVSETPIPVGASCGGEICRRERTGVYDFFRP